MTKPFDETELKSNIRSILEIRKILQEDTLNNLQNSSREFVDNLAKQDSVFIKKLLKVISSNYQNKYFLKADLANKMAYSQSQLLRKVKALINKNPMDMLRDCRLEKAAEELRNGYQVSQVIDMCGFNSLSYFGKCFKKKYGMTPKAYQKHDKEHRYKSDELFYD